MDTSNVHSHLPWRFEGNEIYSEPGYSSIAMLLENGKQEANAALICRAVNNHDALVRALENTLKDLEMYGLDDFEDTTEEAIARIVVALDAAKGEA